MSPTSIPALLWRWYIDALWNYSPDSWVASTAYTFRLLALIVILPGVLLTLLDVTSYVIARTLGDTSAYTSDKTPAPALAAAPSPATPAAPAAPPATPHPAHSPAAAEGESPPAIVVQPGSPRAARFPAFAGAEERLAGVGVFSPAASQPGSPVLGRRQLVRGDELAARIGEESRERAEEGDGDASGDANENGDGDGEGDGAESALRREGDVSESWQNMWGEASTNGSTSGSDSFAILERDESFEDAGAVQMRHRAPRGGAGDAADDS